MGTRKTYTSEYKQEAVRLVTEQGLSIKQVSVDLDVKYETLARWKKEMQVHREKAFPGQGIPLEEEVRRLRREVETLRMERQVLKKAVGIFSQVQA